jgi:hypothetical protein
VQTSACGGAGARERLARDLVASCPAASAKANLPSQNSENVAAVGLGMRVGLFSTTGDLAQADRQTLADITVLI